MKYEDKVMTEYEFRSELAKMLREYSKGRTKNQIDTFKKMLTICSNEFVAEKSKGTIPATKIDWQCFFYGFIAGAQYGQQLAADAMGVGDVTRSATGT